MMKFQNSNRAIATNAFPLCFDFIFSTNSFPFLFSFRPCSYVNNKYHKMIHECLKMIFFFPPLNLVLIPFDRSFISAQNVHRAAFFMGNTGSAADEVRGGAPAPASATGFRHPSKARNPLTCLQGIDMGGYHTRCAVHTARDPGGVRDTLLFFFFFHRFLEILEKKKKKKKKIRREGT